MSVMNVLRKTRLTVALPPRPAWPPRAWRSRPPRMPRARRPRGTRPLACTSPEPSTSAASGRASVTC